MCPPVQPVENLTKVANKIKTISGGHVPLQLIGDLLDPATGTMLVNETIAKFGKLDVLINNAGGASAHGDLLNGAKDLLTDYDAVFKLNVRAPIQLIQLAMPHLIKSKGNILNTVSVDGLTPSQLVYSASKAALIMVTKTSAMDLGPSKVRVNAIAPGPVNTAFGRSYGEPNVYKEHAEDFKKGTVLHRIAEPEEIARLACFLVSDLAENITGSIMVDDAGVMVQKR